jgi:Ca2+-binding RTX toxin-like protein
MAADLADWRVAAGGIQQLAEVALAQAGVDALFGGLGNDWSDRGSGLDYTYGEGGGDTLHGREGNDWLYGGEDND